jgi:hypothetical protein
LLKSIATLDGVLQAHARALGEDFAAYRNHTYRVVNLCAALRPCDGAQLEKIALAAAYHDLGIWTHRTFDYLPPSAALASAHLAQCGCAHWQAEVGGMILEHHKITRYRAEPQSLVEPFRQADWVDVTHGVLTFGLARVRLREIFAAWPDAGFHKRLVQLALKRLVTHPWRPLPMLRL